MKAKQERKQARAQAATGEPARTKSARPGPARARPARAKAARPANDRGDAAIEARLARLEEAVALQTERSDELFDKVEAVLSQSIQLGGPGGEGASSGEAVGSAD